MSDATLKEQVTYLRLSSLDRGMLLKRVCLPILEHFFNA